MSQCPPRSEDVDYPVGPVWHDGPDPRPKPPLNLRSDPAIDKLPKWDAERKVWLWWTEKKP